MEGRKEGGKVTACKKFPKWKQVIGSSYLHSGVIHILTDNKISLQINIVIMPTLSSLVAPQVVIMTTCGATSDDKVGIMTTQLLWPFYLWRSLSPGNLIREPCTKINSWWREALRNWENSSQTEINRNQWTNHSEELSKIVDHKKQSEVYLTYLGQVIYMYANGSTCHYLNKCWQLDPK